MNYNVAFLSPTSPRVAYVAILGVAGSTVAVTAEDEASLIRKLWDDYRLAPSDKTDVFLLPEHLRDGVD